MKRILSAVVSAALILSMTACGGTENTPSDNNLGGNSEMKESTRKTASEASETAENQINVPDDFVLIKGGSFQMGSPEIENWRGKDETLHSVTVSDFYMSRFEITQAEYEKIIGSNPSNFNGENLPVENVSWLDAVRFCNARSESENLTPAYSIDGGNVIWDRSADGYRLPTEAEWEYACRAGTVTPFNTETSISAEEANYYGHYPYEIEENYFSQGNLDTKPGENLGMDYVDLYICHMWDYGTPLYDIMEGLNNVVKVGKARYIGISNCFSWQFAKANALAEKEGFAKFVSVQGHYNLIFREEEREMARLCAEDNIAMTPYSALAGGRLSRKPGETSKRLEQDSYAKFKYDKTAEQDGAIIDRVSELAEKRGVSMTEISLAWLLTKVTSPVVGATKISHMEGAAKAAELELTEEECAYLEELYVPHALVGVMAQNTASSANKKHVWSTGNQKI